MHRNVRSIVATLTLMGVMTATPVSACKVGEEAIIPSRQEVLARDRKVADLVIVGGVTPLSEISPAPNKMQAASAQRYRVTVDHVEKGADLRQVEVDEDVFSSCDFPFGKRHLAIAGKQRVFLRQEDGKWMIVNSEAMTIHPVGDEAADYDILTR